MKEYFNFIEQIKMNYTNIIPKEEYGMIVFLLFDKFGTNVFSENELKKIISDYHNYSEKERELHSIIKLTIQFLTINFIRKSKQGYILTPYSLQFSKEILKKLHRDFSPSEVKKILLKLRIELEPRLQEDNFNEWFDFFERYKTDLDNQIESLDKRIDSYINDFRKVIFDNEKQNTELLKSIREGLEKIKSQVVELTSAFTDIYDIEDLLNRVNINTDTSTTIKNKKKAKDYLTDIRDYLTTINNRIDLIQPRIQEFFSDINRADFDRNTKKFIRHLIKNTTVEKINSKKELVFPYDMALLKEMYKEEFNFTIADNQLKKGKTQSKTVNTVVDEMEIEKKYQNAKKIREQRAKAMLYVKNIKDDLNRYTLIKYSSYFYQIIEDTQNINIAIKVAYLLLNEFTKSQQYIVEISDQVISHDKYKSTVLWEMKISKINLQT